jgi:hypothetical protein
LWGGRRRAVRRGTDGQAVYVDRLPSRILAVVLTIFAFQILDAFFTLFHIARGGQELNPLMDFFLRQGPGIFLWTKLGLAGLGLLFLGAHFRWPLVRKGLTGLFLIYAGVVCYHLILFWMTGASILHLGV